MNVNRIEFVEGTNIHAFYEKLKNNKDTCICSVDYDNIDMKCMCKEFREIEEGICHCGIFIKKKGVLN